MLNIIKSKLKNRYKNNTVNTRPAIFKPKESGLAIRHWKNSIYAYNKNTLSLLPEASKLTINLIKGYFNSYNKKLKKIRKKNFLIQKNLQNNKKIYSTNKIFVSEGQFKHTNDKVNITIYLYNKQILNYISIMKKFVLKKRKFNNKFKEKLKLIKLKGLKYKIIQTRIQKNIISNILKSNDNLINLKNLNQFKIYQNIYFNRLIKKSSKIIIYYMYFLQSIIINKLKFKNQFLQILINLIRKIYKKKIELNLINLKNFYLNSNIFTEMFFFKLKQNRFKLRRHLITFIRKARLINLKDFKADNVFRDNYALDLNLLNIFNNTDLTDTIYINEKKSKNLEKVIYNNIKYKKLLGVRLQASGRLTRRYTAARSLTKVKHKGSISNIYSSFYKDPSVLLRGKYKSNLEYTKLNSTTRIGAFGIKGWVSGI